MDDAHRRTWIPLALVPAAIGAATLTRAADPRAAAICDSRRIVSQYRNIFEFPPRFAPSGNSTDAPLMGNGDMAVCVAGPPEAQRFYFNKNDF